MKRAALWLLLVTAALAGCGGATPAVRSGVGILHTPQASRAAEIRAARDSDPTLFALFPERPGSKACSLPAGGIARTLAGRCRTSVTYPNEHGPYAEAFVHFRESWGRRHASSWTVIVQWPAEKVVATQLHGDTAPQNRYAATDGVAGRLLGAEVQVAAYPHGDVRICGLQSSDLMFNQPPPNCRNGLRAVGVDVSALASRAKGSRERWGTIYLEGRYRDGTFRVASRRKWAPRGVGPPPFFEKPPCPAPSGGWSFAPPTPSQQTALRAYERRYRGDVTSVVYFHHATLPVVSALHPARVRQVLARSWPRQLCVVRARWSLHLLSRARRRMLGLLHSYGNKPRYGWIDGAGGLSESDAGQPTTTLEVLVETPALRNLLRAYPPGLVAVDAVLRPVRS